MMTRRELIGLAVGALALREVGFMARAQLPKAPRGPARLPIGGDIDEAMALAVPLIKEFEGLHQRRADGMIEAYADAGYGWKVPTIGYGHTSTAERGMVITAERAEELLLKIDLPKYMAAVEEFEKRCPRPFTPHQKAALLSFAFNAGPRIFANSPSVGGRLRAGDYDGAANGLLKFCFSNGKKLAGLERRRRAERELFLTGAADEDDDVMHTRATPTPVDKPLVRSTTIPAATTAGAAGAVAAVEQTADAGIVEKVEAVTGLAPHLQGVVLLLLIAAPAAWIIFERVRKGRRGDG